MGKLIGTTLIRTEKTYSFVYSYKMEKLMGKVIIITGQSAIFINNKVTPLTYGRQVCEFDDCPYDITGKEYETLKKKIIKAVKRSVKRGVR